MPKSKPLFASILAAVSAMAAGCGSYVDTGPGSTRPPRSADAADAPPETGPPSLCVRPGTPNNEKGVGGYCRPGANDCQGAGGFHVCSADFGGDGWFCTGPCAMDPDCGSGQYCSHTAQGSGCVPLACAPSDGGATDATDATDAADAADAADSG